MNDDYTVPVNRPLSEQELALLRWLLDHGTPEAAAFEVQLADIHVCATCSCGCPTIDLALGANRSRTIAAS